jgi:hypothetical protein
LSEPVETRRKPLIAFQKRGLDVSKKNKKKSPSPIPDPSLPQAIPIKKARAQLGISYWTVLRLFNQGVLPGVRLPGKRGHQRILVSVEGLRAYIAGEATK